MKAVIRLALIFGPLLAASHLMQVEAFNFILMGLVYLLIAAPMTRRAMLKDTQELPTPSNLEGRSKIRFLHNQEKGLNAFAVPRLFGRDCIVVSKDFVRYPTYVQNSILRHEIAHLRFHHGFLSYGLILTGVVAIMAFSGFLDASQWPAVLGAVIIAADMVYNAVKGNAKRYLTSLAFFVGLPAILFVSAYVWSILNGYADVALGVAQVASLDILIWLLGRIPLYLAVTATVVFFLEWWADVASASQSRLEDTIEFMRPRLSDEPAGGLLGAMDAHPPWWLRKRTGRSLLHPETTFTR